MYNLLQKHLVKSQKNTTFAADYVILYNQNTTDNVIFSTQNSTYNVICYA